MSYLLLLAALLTSPAVRADTVSWAPVTEGKAQSSIKVTGRVVAKEGALKIEPARVPGRVVNILKRDGDYVRAGTALFDINSAECSSLAEEKRVAESRALQDLIDGTNRRARQLGLELALDGCRIVATHSGTITKRQVEVGAAFNQGDPLVTLLDTKSLIVELDVPEGMLTRLSVGQKVKLSLASAAGSPQETAIEHILPTIDPSTRTSKVRLKPTVLPMRTTIDSLVFGEIVAHGEEKLLQVPAGAVVFSQNRQYVVKRAEPSPVAVPVEVMDETEGTSSLAADAKLLKPGDEVAVKGAIFLLRKISNL